jgi:hypothetical protein
MLFKRYHVFPMWMGIKQYTRRFSEFHPKVGSTYKCRHDYTAFSFGTIKILDVYRQPLGMMTEKDAYQEGGYTLDQYKKTLEMITKKPWDPEAGVWVIKFQFVPSDVLDPNGGTHDFDEYRKLYYQHLKEVS